MILLLLKLIVFAIIVGCCSLVTLYVPITIPYILLTAFIIPWKIITPLGLYIKEGAILGCTALILFRAMHFKTLRLDFPGKIYLCFIGLCFSYYTLQILRNGSTENLSFLTHIFITTFLIALVYVCVYNIPFKNEIQIKHFLWFSCATCLIAIFYLIYLNYSVHKAGGFGLVRGFLSTENEMLQEGSLKKSLIYIGNSNGKSWFTLISFSYFIGYFIGSQKKPFLQIIIAALPLIVSTLHLSRGAILGSLLISIITLTVSVTRLKKTPGKLIVLILLLTLTFTGAFLKVKDTFLYDGVMWSIEQKMNGGSAGRDILVFENARFIMDSYFLGKGFHYRVMTPDYEFIKKGYPHIAIHNPHNQVLSITSDLGLLALILFSLFFIYTFRHGFILSQKGKTPLQKGVGWAGMLIIIALFTSFPFTHNIEKNIKTFAIYMIFFALTNTTDTLFIEGKLNDKHKN